MKHKGTFATDETTTWGLVSVRTESTRLLK
uniref:Uncharacterized protein n=1 Tax=Physcomitrium patens TaxID=3218 RepID=A0A2K1J0F6_PHYPA|nr:hypothetical protein PHYPA_022907 [Physcomitrium patens]